MELMSVEEAAEHWGVSASRARSILSRNRIRRISGYDAAQVRAVQLRQGARTDLEREQRDPALESRIRKLFADTGDRYTSTLDLMLDGTVPPLLTGRCDTVSDTSRRIRITGPLAAGKSVAAGQIAARWHRSGRRLIVVRAGGYIAHGSTYSRFGTTSSDDVIVIESQPGPAGLAPAAPNGANIERITEQVEQALTASSGRPTAIVLDDLPYNDQLATARAVLALADQQPDTAVIIPAVSPSDVVGDFDTEIVLPGTVGGIHIRAAEEYASTLVPSGDELTRARVARLLYLRPGDWVQALTSALRDHFLPTSAEYSYLHARIRGIDGEPRLAPLDAHGLPPAAGGRVLHNGVMRDPQGRLSEYVLTPAV